MPCMGVSLRGGGSIVEAAADHIPALNQKQD